MRSPSRCAGADGTRHHLLVERVEGVVLEGHDHRHTGASGDVQQGRRKPDGSLDVDDVGPAMLEGTRRNRRSIRRRYPARVAFEPEQFNGFKVRPFVGGIGVDEAHICGAAMTFSKAMIVAHDVLAGHFSFSPQDDVMRAALPQLREGLALDREAVARR